VTDGDESSTQDAQDFFKALTMIKGDENLFTLFGVYGASDLACKPAFGEGPWNFKGSDREKFIQRTGGKYYDICDKDFGNNLQQIFRAAVKRVVLPKVFLKSRPIVSTIQVKYRDTVLAPGLEESGGFWFYDPEINALIFHNLDFAKYDNDSVTVTYTEDDGYQPL
jgi:hypothetical protein